MTNPDWKGSLVLRWDAERESRPSKKELEYWPITISELRMKLAIERDRSARGDLHHRLVMALIKLEDYQAAAEAADEALGEGTDGWTDMLSMDKAEVLYLMGKENEAMALVDRLVPTVEEGPVNDKVEPSRIPEPYMEVCLICPDCDGQVRYGSKTCAQCGREVGEGFRVARRPSEVRKIENYPIARSSNEGGTAPSHRIKEFTIGFTTWTIDHDDPENFLTTHQHRLFGQETTTITEKGWYTGVGAATLVLSYLALGFMVMMSSFTGMPLVIALIWAAAVIPLTALYIWVLWPPDGLSSGP